MKERGKSDFFGGFESGVDTLVLALYEKSKSWNFYWTYIIRDKKCLIILKPEY